MLADAYGKFGAEAELWAYTETSRGLEVNFQTLDPALAPQPVLLKMGGDVRVLLVKLSRSFETTRTDFERVVPDAEPDPTEPGAALRSISVPE